MPPYRLASPLLEPVRHGFFTRQGGVSTGPYRSLNCGLRTDDLPANISANRALVARSLGIDEPCLVSATQVHSNRVAVVTSPDNVNDWTVDGLVTRVEGLAVAVQTADCQPILLADSENRVIGALHGGWRGTTAGIIEEGIECMVSLGARRERISAVIGPAIGMANYEVGSEVLDAATQRYPWASNYFSGNDSGRYQMDLPGIGLQLLRNEGIGNCEKLDRCTYEEENLFYSWRRSTHRGQSTCGIMISAIIL